MRVAPTPSRLIVNADDFGLTPGVNRAVAELYLAGALTSTTLMSGGAAFADAVALAHANPGLGVGCHVVFTDGLPCSRPETIPTLLGPDRHAFRPSLNAFLAAAITGRIRRDDLKREAIAQIQTLQHAGVKVTHLDTHKHTHILPQVAGPLLEAALETGVRAMRNPFEGGWSLRLGHTRTLRLLSVAGSRLLRRSFLHQPAIRSGAVRTTAGTIGISATGRLDETALRPILAALPAHGTWELVCHPGYNDAALDAVTTRLRSTREVERRALLAAVPTLNRNLEHPGGPEIIHYGKL